MASLVVFPNVELRLCLFVIITSLHVSGMHATDDDTSIESWTGRWFPYNPAEHAIKSTFFQDCDDGIHSIGIDFDPNNQTHVYNYVCIANRTLYESRRDVSAALTEHLLPLRYTDTVRCLNESIDYMEPLPTFGAHRLLSPEYGEYKYLPPQRWTHSLHKGAIVLLYHPCATVQQVALLRSIVQSCTEHYIITPSPRLTPQHPLALLSLGKCLRMSAVRKQLSKDFIRNNTKWVASGSWGDGDNNVATTLKTYQVGLIKRAKINGIGLCNIETTM